MDYLTRAEVDIYLRTEELPLDQNDDVNEDKITLCINLVKGEIEPFLSEGGYIVPLTTQSQVDSLKHISLPIFKYYVNSDSGSRTEQIVNDYQFARSQLKRIASNEINLTAIDKQEDNLGNGSLKIVKLDIY